MNKRGFTLVELLVAISLLAILTVIAIPTLRAFQTNNDKKTYENYGKSMVASAKLYNDSYSDDLFGNLDNGCQKVTLTEMINKKVAKDITLKDVTCNKAERDSYVLVWKYKDEYAFDPVVNCVNSKGANQYEDKNEALAEACVTATGKPYITVNTVTNEANNTKKKSVIINLNDDFGFTANQEIEYAWSTINNDAGSGVTGYKKYSFNNSYIKRKNDTVKLSTRSITIPSATTGTYYLYVKPVKVQNIINESITNIHKYGPYRFDHEPPACPTIKAYKGTEEIAKNTAAGINKFTLNYSADDLQNYELKVSYDNGSSWSEVETYSKDKNEYIPTKDGTIIIKTRAKDYANNESAWCTSETYIRDTTPPTAPTVTGYKKANATDISSKGSLSTHASNNWLSGWIFTQASGSSDVNGVKYYYTTTGKTTNNENVNSSYRNINAEGESTVKFRACDDVGNCSGWVSYIAKLDRTAPTGLTLTGYTKTNGNNASSGSGLSAYSAGTWLHGYVLVVASGAKDALGNGENYYNGTTKTSYVNVNNQGSTNITMKVCDNLNNCSAEESFAVKLDRCEATKTTWKDWSGCSVVCGGGTKTRTGTKYSTVSGHTSYNCGGDSQTESCNTQSCTKTVKVTFKPNGADGNDIVKSCSYNIKNATSCVITAPTVTRSGWTLLGWNTKAFATSSGFNAEANKAFSADATYYAITSREVTAQFIYQHGAQYWNGGSTKVQKSCTIYNSGTCSVTAPAIKNFPNTAKSGCGCLYNQLFEVKGWNKSAIATSGTVANNETISISGGEKFYSIMIANSNYVNNTNVPNSEKKLRVYANSCKDEGHSKNVWDRYAPEENAHWDGTFVLEGHYVSWSGEWAVNGDYYEDSGGNYDHDDYCWLYLKGKGSKCNSNKECHDNSYIKAYQLEWCK